MIPWIMFDGEKNKIKMARACGFFFLNFMAGF